MLRYTELRRWKHLSPPTLPAILAAATPRRSYQQFYPRRVRRVASCRSRNILIFPSPFLYIYPRGAKWVVKHEGFCPGATLKRRGINGGSKPPDRINDKGAEQASAWGPTRWSRKCGLKIFYDAACRTTREDSARGLKRGTRRSYFHRLCPAAPRKYSGAKYVNERNTSCKSEGDFKGESLLPTVRYRAGWNKKAAGIGGPAGTSREKRGGSREAPCSF